MDKHLLLLLLCTACAPGARPSTPTVSPDTGRVAVEGGTLYYESRGSGPVVILLHGGRLDLTMWNPQVRPLAQHFRVIRYDARGHGRSTATVPASPVEDLRRVLDHLGVKEASLVGLSMGGGVAFGFALQHPERVDKLVLASTSVHPPGIPKPPGMGPDLTDPAARQRLRNLQIPVLLIVGERDAPSLLAINDTVAQHLNIRKVSLPGAGHMANAEQPEAFNRLLLRFLRSR